MGFVANALGGLCAALVPTMANWVAKVPLSRSTLSVGSVHLCVCILLTLNLINGTSFIF